MLRFACSVALRIASGTSRALPLPKPTRPFWSPTTTSAAKPNRLPPFTVLETRLIATRRSANSGLSSRSRPRPPLSSLAISPPLELQPALAGGIGERLHLSVEKEAAAIEIDLFDPGRLRTRRDLGPDLRRDLLVVLALQLELGVERRSRRKRASLNIVDHLDIDVLRRTMHRKPRLLARNLLDPGPDAQAAFAEQFPFAGRHLRVPYFFLPSLRKTNSSRYLMPLPL